MRNSTTCAGDTVDELPSRRPGPGNTGYLLDAFLIVRREDQAAIVRYRTKDMILAYMNALATGDTETDVAM